MGEDAVREARLVPPAIACWIAVALLVASPGTAVIWSAGFAAITGALITTAVFLRRPLASRVRLVRTIAATAALCAGVIALGACSIAERAEARQPADLGRGVVTVTLRLDGQAVAQPGGESPPRIKVRGTVTRVAASDVVTDASVPATLFAPPPHEATTLAVGALVTARVTAVPNDPGDPVAYRLYARAAPLPLEASPWWLGWANGLRSGFADAAARLPAPGGGLLPGLAIGDVSAVSPGLDADMKASSLSHLTAVSGSNCAVIVAGVMGLAALAGLGRRTRVVLALIALGGFVVLVTPGPSVLRAALMAVIVIVALASGRPGGGIPALCLAVIGLLVADPWLARDYGFVLSVLATAGLLVLTGPFTRALARWLPRRLAAVIAIPLAAQLACQPVLVLLQPALPTFGVVANLLAEPAAPVATVFGLLACLVLPVVPGVGFALAQLAWLPASWIAGVATFTTSLPAHSLPWLAGVPGVATAVLLGLAVVLAMLPASGEARWRRLIRSAALVGLLLFVGGYGGGVLASGLARQLSVPKDWQLGACDVGQGDAIVLRGGGGDFGLIDTGPDPEPLEGCLDRLGIDHVELLVLTHFDADHVGGVEAVMGRVGTALVGPVDRPAARRLVRQLREGGARVIHASEGMSGTLGDLEWRVLWPRTGEIVEDGNASSVTLETLGDGVRSIFLGDLDERAQSLLLAEHEVSPVDVVKVAHHGSADQSERLYRALGARVGLISVGAENRYGHPTDRVLAMLQRVGTTVERTDRDGILLLGADAGRLTIWSERPSATDSHVGRPR